MARAWRPSRQGACCFAVGRVVVVFGVVALVVALRRVPCRRRARVASGVAWSGSGLAAVAVCVGSSRCDDRVVAVPGPAVPAPGSSRRAAFPCRRPATGPCGPPGGAAPRDASRPPSHRVVGLARGRVRPERSEPPRWVRSGSPRVPAHGGFRYPAGVGAAGYRRLPALPLPAVRRFVRPHRDAPRRRRGIATTPTPARRHPRRSQARPPGSGQPSHGMVPGWPGRCGTPTVTPSHRPPHVRTRNRTLVHSPCG